MSVLLLRGRQLIVGAAADGTVEIIPQGALVAQDGEIIDVGRYEDLVLRHQPDDELGSLTDHVVMPGLINAHHHVGLTPFQLGTLELPLETWIPARRGRRRPDPHLDTMYGAIRMIEAGVTTVMHNAVVGTQPGAAPEAGGRAPAHRILEAYEAAGMRVAFSLFHRDQNRLVYDDDEAFLSTLPQSLADPLRSSLAAAPSNESYFEHLEELFAEYGRDRSGRVRILFSPANVQWCSDGFLRDVKDYASRYDTGIHIHLMESVYQKMFGLQTWGKTPLQHLEDIGFLGPEVSCAHGVWLTERDMEILGQRGTTICHNPSSNLRLKSGIAPVTRMLSHRVPVALGIDEAGLNDDNDMLQEMRLTAKIHREPGIEAPDLTSGQVLHMATIAGARATCFADKIGTLERGKRCDAIPVDLRRIGEPYLHPETDPVDAILYRGKEGDVDSVVIDGSVVLRHRELVTIDKAQVFAEIRQSLALPPSRAELLEQQRARELQAHVEAFFSKWEAATSQPHYLVNSAR